MPAPQRSTVTPMRPMRRLLITIVIGIVDSTSTARFHSGARNRYAAITPSTSSGNR